MAQRLEDAIKTLDHDPHYRYELRFGEGTPPSPPRTADRPGLVMHFMNAVKDGRWTTVDVIARCAASIVERPITIKGTLTAEPGSAFADDVDAFFTYGAPFVSPEGAFDGVLDAPAGLGGPLVAATLTTGPTEDNDLGANIDLHLEVIDPANVPLAAVDIRRTERSQGIKGGMRFVLEEVHGLFAIEDRYDLPKGRGRRSVSFGDVTGKPVTVTYAALRVLSELHAPNKMRISVRHTALSRGVVDSNIGFDWDADTLKDLRVATRALETLAFLQEHASAAIMTPDFAKTPPEQFPTWRRAAALLRGQELSATYPEGQQLMIDLASEVTPVDGEDVRIRMPFVVHVASRS